MAAMASHRIYIYIYIPICSAKWKKQIYRDRLTVAVHWLWLVSRRKSRVQILYKLLVNMEGVYVATNWLRNDTTWWIYSRIFEPLISCRWLNERSYNFNIITVFKVITDNDSRITCVRVDIKSGDGRCHTIGQLSFHGTFPASLLS